jgi:hypothetical protein
VGFDQRFDADRARSAEKRRDLGIGERRDDEQDGVGSGRACLDDLVAIDDEVLAQDRQLAGRAGRAQIVEASAEERAVGEDRERLRAARGVGARGGGRIGGRENGRFEGLRS